MMAVANAPSGTIISGPISKLPFGVDAVGGNSELNLRSFAQRARCVHSAIVRPYCLPRDGQPQARSARLVRYVRLPDCLQLFRGDAFAVVGNRDPNRALTSRRHGSGA